MAVKLLLLLDYDGTLVEIKPRPELAAPDEALLSLLRRLAELMPVGVLSGRSLRELEEWLGGTGVYLVGEHGLYGVTPRGQRFYSFRPAVPPRWYEPEIPRLRKLLSSEVKYILERKEFALALHYRQVAGAKRDELIAAFTAWARGLSCWPHLEILPGKMVHEVRPRGVHKGLAVRYLCQLFPGYQPWFWGDDITDSQAWQEVWQRGGVVHIVQEKEGKEGKEVAGLKNILQQEALRDGLMPGALKVVSSPAEVRAMLARLLVAAQEE